ncbi:MAG TPA: hypothetical protein PLX60_10135 [Chitinophagales bacterium]|jgi:hypothetical protein|nr:hypothetical protein [Chitinophagales bacterium]
MSDFGTMIIATKKDNNGFTNSELSDLSSKLKSIIKKEDYTNALGKDFMDDFQEESDGSAIVLLSEHFYGGDIKEDEESFDFVKESELEQAKEMAEKLSIEFSEIDFDAQTEEW